MMPEVGVADVWAKSLGFPFTRSVSSYIQHADIEEQTVEDLARHVAAVLKPEGENGFGYDPIFYVEECRCSTAALSREQKNAISHRGNALRAIKGELKKRM